MESLESKLCRLSQEQQREVEDFVDFLLQRQGEKSVPLIAPVISSEFPVAVAPPPLTVQESPPEPHEARIEVPVRRQDRQPVYAEEDPANTLIQKIAPEKEDSPASEYMDYGSFEQAPVAPPSPATEAVQRVKIKLSAKKAQDPTKNMLDWID